MHLSRKTHNQIVRDDWGKGREYLKAYQAHNEDYRVVLYVHPLNNNNYMGLGGHVVFYCIFDIDFDNMKGDKAVNVRPG